MEAVQSGILVFDLDVSLYEDVIAKDMMSDII